MKLKRDVATVYMVNRHQGIITKKEVKGYSFRAKMSTGRYADFIVHRDASEKTTNWSVSEKTSGALVSANHRTIKKAVEESVKKIETQLTTSIINKAIKEIDKYETRTE